MNVLVCRPEKDALALVEQLNSKGVSAYSLPTIKIEFINVKADFTNYTSIIFTSKYAVESFINQFSVGRLKNKKIYSVGASTANLLKKYGICSKYPTKYNSQALLSLLQQDNISDERFLIISGVSGNDSLITELSKQVTCKKLEVYQRVFEKEEWLISKYRRVFGVDEADIVVATSLDVFKSLSRIFTKINISKTAIITITSTKMLEFVSKEGFINTLKLERLDNDYISKRILEVSRGKK